MLRTFSFGCFQIYQNKSAKNIAVHFIETITIVPIKCMPKISAVGLFCLEKFENNQTRTCTTFFRTSKLTEVYFSEIKCFRFSIISPTKPNSLVHLKDLWSNDFPKIAKNLTQEQSKMSLH